MDLSQVEHYTEVGNGVRDSAEIFIRFECSYEDHPNGFIILIQTSFAGRLGARIHLVMPLSLEAKFFHSLSKIKRKKEKREVTLGKFPSIEL